jgi:hypothetical protein
MAAEHNAGNKIRKAIRMMFIIVLAEFDRAMKSVYYFQLLINI